MYKPIALVLLLVAGTFARHINQEGLNLIKGFEGFRANFYNDAVGIKTIGVIIILFVKDLKYLLICH